MSEISKEKRETIEVDRKYGLRPGTLKCDIYKLFDKGYTPVEVRYLLQDSKAVTNDPLSRSIRRYYYYWKKEQMQTPVT